MPGAALYVRDSCSTHRKTSPKHKWTWERLLLFTRVFLMPQPGVMPFLASGDCPIKICGVNPLELGCCSFGSPCLYWWISANPAALEQPVVIYVNTRWYFRRWCGVCVEFVFLSGTLNSLVVNNLSLFCLRTTSWLLRKQMKPSPVVSYTQ